MNYFLVKNFSLPECFTARCSASSTTVATDKLTRAAHHRATVRHTPRYKPSHRASPRRCAISSHCNALYGTTVLPADKGTVLKLFS